MRQSAPVWQRGRRSPCIQYPDHARTTYRMVGGLSIHRVRIFVQVDKNPYTSRSQC